MRSCVWTVLLRCIPPEHHNILMLVTTGGTEIALQNIMRLDDEMIVIKGRLSGSQDMGRLYFVPLDNIDYFGFNRIVKDEEFTAMFGDFQAPPETPAAAPPAPQVVVQPSPSHHDTPPPEPEPQADTPPEPSSAPLKAPLPIKSAVLERFRSRGSASFSGSGLRPPNE
jgi:hypothetical protein